MAEEDKKHLFRFDGNNFNNWKYRMSMLLEEKELEEYIEEDLEIITLEATDREYRKHIKNEKKCKALLVKHIANDQLEYVKDKATAKDMYDSLCAVFERNSMAGQLWLRKKLITMKYQDNGKMTEHLLEFDKTVRELRAIGGKLEEMDVVCHLLLSLPTSYDSVVTSLETLSPKMLNMEFVKNRLLDENNKRNGKMQADRNDGNGIAAMNAKSYQFRCHNCGREGHKRSECRLKGNSERLEYQRSGDRLERPECHYVKDTRSECCKKNDWTPSDEDDRAL